MSQDWYISDRLVASAFTAPKPMWKWSFTGDWYAMSVVVPSAPCWFHRVMLRWVLGIHWARI